MRKVVPAVVAALAGICLVAAGAVAILLTVLLGTSSAATQPPGTMTVGTASNQCLRAAASSGTVKVATCDPQRRSQWWVATSGGRYRLAGTREYAVPSSAGLALGTWAQAPSWAYQNHLVMTEGQFLDQMSTGQPALGSSPETWFEFVKQP